MKLSAEQITRHLQSQHAPLYIIASDEPLLTGEMELQFRQHFYQKAFREQLILTPAVEQNWDVLSEQLTQGLLFAENLFIVVRLLDNKCPDKIIALLVEFARNPHPARVILLVFSKLDSAMQKTKWFTQLEQAGIFIPLWPPREYEYSRWLQQRAAQHEITLSSEELNILTEFTQGNLIAGAQVIEKLKLFPSSPGENRVHAILQDVSQFDLFDLNDAILAQNVDKTLHILSRLKLQHTEPILILWAITKQVRELIQFHELLQQGENLNKIFQRFRILPQRHQLLSQMLKHPQLPRWQQSLSYSHLIDKMIKGLHSGDIWLALEELCLLLVGIEVSFLSLQWQGSFLL